MMPVVNKRKREGIQLCKVYIPGKKNNPTHFYLEPKFDGIRCVITIRNGKVEALTSTGLPIYNVEHIKAVFEPQWTNRYVDNMMFDGELLSKELGFSKTSGICRDHEPSPDAHLIKFYVWDTLPLHEFDEKKCATPLKERRIYLNELVTRIGNPSIEEVPYVEGFTHDDILTTGLKYVAEGNEGIVIKAACRPYEFRKSDAWLKWKPKNEVNEAGEMKTQLEGDLIITGFYEGEPGGRNEGRLGGFELLGYLKEDGNIGTIPERGDTVIICESGSGFDDAERDAFWKKRKKMIGKTVEIRYDSITDDKSLRFPIFYRLREDKDE